MDLDLTAEQRALRKELTAYFAGLLTPAERAALLSERHGGVYREVVRRMGRDGWLGVGWPREYGGRGLGPVEQQIFVNEAARADVPLPAVTLQTVGPTLQAHGSAEQKGFFLARILAGEVHFAIGYTELRWLEVQVKRNTVLTFGGGVNEIQRELITTAGLGLPRVLR